MTDEQDAKWRDIKVERDFRESYGGVSVAGKWFHVDTKSRLKYLGLLSLGPNIPPGLQWKTMDGTFILMTQALAGQLFGALAVLDTTLFGVAENHRAAMLQSSDPANYDFSSGWPPKFQG